MNYFRNYEGMDSEHIIRAVCSWWVLSNILLILYICSDGKLSAQKISVEVAPSHVATQKPKK